MTDTTHKKGVNPIATAVGGVVVGVGLAVAGAMAMKDKATKKRVEDGIDKVRAKGDSVVNDVARKIEKTANDVKAQSEDVSEKVSKKAQSAKDGIENTVTRTKVAAKDVVKDIKNS